MKPTVRVLLIAIVLVISAHRLPAPIAEVQETPAAKEIAKKIKPKPKSKSSETEHDSTAKSRGRFDGTWTASTTSTGEHHEQIVDKLTMVIKEGKNAALVNERTSTLAPGGYWRDLPAATKFSGLYSKSRRHSNDVVADGSHLRIRWSAPEILEWTPQQIPLGFWQQALKKSPGAVTSVYTVSGDTLKVGYDAGGSVTLKRVSATTQ